jgi:hypothetical protein
VERHAGVLDEHPDATLDETRYVNWYAWSDPGEDFAETLATFVGLKGRTGGYRGREGVYGKLEALRAAGAAVLAQNAVLRACNRRGFVYLSAGEIAFKCPDTGERYGVPGAVGQYVCPCGAWVINDGRWVGHAGERAV